MRVPPQSPLPIGWGQQLVPVPGSPRLGLVHGNQLLADVSHPAERPYVAVNFVASVDGRAVVNGSAAGLGSPTDQLLMRRLRAEADAVMHGAGTLRADRV